MSRQPTQRDKTARAFCAYLDLVDAADWIRKELAGPLDFFGLTINEFRLLYLLYREGPMPVGDAAKKRECNRQNLHKLIDRAEKWGWVCQKAATLPPAEKRESQLSKAKRGRPRKGYRVVIVSLTPAGKNLIETALPRHAKLVKSYMRTLHGCEQLTLSRLCRKLRERDILKFFKEIRMVDADEDLNV
jgi:DNA-binding MarR family transcriptional regulator